MEFKYLKRIRLWHLLVFIATLAFLLGLLLPARSGKVDTVINGGPLMKKIYNQVIAGETKDNILASLSEREKNILKAYHLAWLDSVPIITKFGKLKSEYLPVDHVVVYGVPESESGSKKWAQEAYMNANGLRFYCFRDTGASLGRLIQTTRYGTSDILMGSISDMSEISNPEIYQNDAICEYLLLKKLIVESHDFPEYAFDLAFRKETSTRLRLYVEKLLRDAVETPHLPDVALSSNGEINEKWKSWYQNNAENVKISNKFLFDNE